jgi:hypothetical protein
MFSRLLKADNCGYSIEVADTTKVITAMGSKRDIIFYIVAANIIGILLGIAGVNLFVVLFASLIGPPVLLLVFRILRHILRI